MLVFGREEVDPMFAALHDEFVRGRIDGERIIAGEASQAKFTFRLTGGANHPRDIEITDGICAEVLANLLEGALIREQLFRVWKVDSIMACKAMRGA